MSDTLPYFPHYKADDVLETQFLSIEAVGAYHLLQVQYFNLGKLPNDEEKIRRITRMHADRRWPKVKAELIGDIFTPDWRHPKWDVMVAKLRAKQAKAAASVKTRYVDHSGDDALAEVPF